jgi:penicillin-binding protein 1A
MSLGAGETTLLRMATSYCMIANGGRQVRATLIDRIQDRWGRTVWRHDQRICEGCKAEAWQGQEEPEILDDRKQIIDPHTAYQMTSILEGVIQRGTAQSLKRLGRPIAGKTGTTNEEKDAWFLGYSPDLVVGVYIGYDTPRPMGKGQTGGRVAAPVFSDFMKEALADTPPAPFRIPPGIKLVRVDLRTGLRASADDPKSLMEAFKPGEEPDDAYSVIGFTGGTGGMGEDGAPPEDTYYQPAPSRAPTFGSGRGGLW